MVQFSGDRFILPGYRGVIDLDFFDGTEAEFSTFFGLSPLTSPPLPTDTEKLAQLWAWYKESHP
jgi:hypothetical protein